MKKLTSCLGMMVMVGMMAVPVSAQQTTAPGMGRQQAQSAQVSEREREFQQAWQQHMADTRDLRHQLAVKRHEMATMLVKPEETSKEQLLKQQNEIQKLQDKLQQEELSFRWDMRQKYPELLVTDIYGGCLAPAMGMEEAPARGRDSYYGIGPMWYPGELGQGYLGPGRVEPLPPNVEENRPFRDENR